jgi:CPA1 family monovalent cation:H+ antiporter
VLGAVAGSIGWGDVVSELLLVAGGGTMLGWAGGWAVAHLRRRLHDPLVEITVTLLAPYVLFVGAEELGLSGILAAVVSGIYLGSRDHTLTDPTTRLQAYGFWTVFTFLLESLLFILVGLQFPEVIDRLGERSTGELLVAGLVLSGVVIAVRLLHQFTVLELDERLGHRTPISARERLVVGWAGMRGAISLAVALAIPLTTDAGAPFPERDAIIFLTLCVIVVTLVGQGLTLPALVRRLPVEGEVPDDRRRARTRFRTIEAALEHIGGLSPSRDGVDEATIERARSLYAQRANQLAGECRDGVPLPESDTGAWLRLRLDLLATERDRLAQLRNEGRITTPMMNAVQEDLDLEASRLQRRLVAGGRG